MIDKEEHKAKLELLKDLYGKACSFCGDPWTEDYMSRPGWGKLVDENDNELVIHCPKRDCKKGMLEWAEAHGMKMEDIKEGEDEKTY